MTFDLQQAQALINAEVDRRRREAPTNRRELEGWLIYAIGLPMASIHYPIVPMEPTLEDRKNRFTQLWENDPVFRCVVNAAVTNTMILFDDYLHRLRRPEID